MHEMTLTERIKALSSRPNGMHSSDIPDRKGANVGASAANLVRRRELHRVVFSRRHVRFYTDPVIAEAIRERIRNQFVKPCSKVLAREEHAPWPANTPAFKPDHVKVQYCPSHAPRFQEHVIPFVHGGLRCA